MSGMVVFLWLIGAGVVALAGFFLGRPEKRLDYTNQSFEDAPFKQFSHKLTDPDPPKPAKPPPPPLAANKDAEITRPLKPMHTGGGGGQRIGAAPRAYEMPSGRFGAAPRDHSDEAAPAEQVKEVAAKPGKPTLRIGYLVENFPENMTVGIPVPVEARITAGDADRLKQAMKGLTKKHKIKVGAVMSVRLVGTGDNFSVEAWSPEAQWVTKRKADFIGLEQSARWRWVITPNNKGTFQLSLIVSVKNVGPDGMIGDIAYPENAIKIAVKTNFKKTVGLQLKWVGALVLGGAITSGYEYLVTFFTR